MKILSVVGARPQFVKLAPVATALDAAGEEHVIVHTGQHYDERMSDVFFADLQIPSPDVHLGIGSGTHGEQTGAMLAALDGVLAEHRPDWVLVYGDTNSTLAGAIAAVKLHLPLAHLEAGLRSHNRRMPEEHNRVLTDHSADLLLAPTQIAMEQLAHEGLAARSVLVGDVMTDICRKVQEAVRADNSPLPGDYLVATIHRPDNSDDPQRLQRIIMALRELPVPVLLVAHPRLVARCAEFGIEIGGGSLRGTAPFTYPQMVRAVMGSVGVITDSGGLQKEAYLLGVPCTTLRSETEWPETLVDGWNLLDPDVVLLNQVAARARPELPRQMPYGDGDAASAVVRTLQARR